MTGRFRTVLVAGCLLSTVLGAYPASAQPLQQGSAPPAAASGTVPRAWMPFVTNYALPGKTTLNAISDPNGAGNFVVSWTAASSAASYLLQQDTDSAFPHPATVYSDVSTQWQAVGQAPGLYFYRVQAVNVAGSGPWSNVGSVRVYGYLTPNDQYYSYQWAPGVISAPLAWYYSQGSNVTIAIVDTGVDLNHPDLSGKVLSGYNFVSGNTNVQDDNGHGTHVAGIAAATGNNGIGVAGMAWQARILPVKVLDSTGSGYISDIANGITWAAQNGAKIVNLSLGSQNYSSTLAAATSYVYNQGGLVTAAAGNCGDGSYSANGCSYMDATMYPAANPNVIAVGATDSSDQRASFSNTGSYLWVSAPGVDIASTLWSAGASTYGYESGTSMASPMVSGLEALIWGVNPGLSNAQVAALLANTATKLSSGFDPNYGYGRINAGAAVVAVLPGSAGAAQAASLAAPRPAPAAPAVAASARLASAAAAANQPVRKGVVLVKMRPASNNPAGKAQAMGRHGVQPAGEIAALGVTVAKVPPGQERKAAADLDSDPDVQYAEPDYQVSLIR